MGAGFLEAFLLGYTKCDMWMRVVVLVCAAAGTRAQEDPKSLLALAGQHVMDSVGRLPDYVATVTIERKSFEPRVGRQLHSCDDVAAEQKSSHWRVRLATSDIVRVDVASGVPNDVYSWVGENHYVAALRGIQLPDDRDSRQLVLPGAATTGGLSGLAAVVFSGQDDADFSYIGDQNQRGRLLAEFGFNVPPQSSHLRFLLPSEQITTGYDGRFLVDAESGKLTQLIVRTALLPAHTGMCEVTQSLDYGTVTLGDEGVLLPVLVTARFTRPDGTELENRMTYSNFRRVSSATTAGDVLASAEPIAPPHAGLPSGIRFTIALSQAVDTATAEFGDRIQAVLINDMVDKSGTVLVPAGAVVNGRVIKLVRVYGKTELVYSVTIMLRWESVNLRGISQPFTARLVRKGSTWVGNLFVEQRLEQFSDNQGVLLLEADGLPLRISDNGVFEMRGLKPGHVLPKGSMSIWETAAQ